MTATRHIEAQARVLSLRLRLRLVDLAAIQQWASQAILEDGGAHPDLTDLCLATNAGERITLRLLSGVGGAPTGLDAMRAFGTLRVDQQSQEELSQLAHALDPVLKEIEAAGGEIPELLQPAMTLAEDFHAARAQGAGVLADVEADMRVVLHAVKEFAAELPQERAKAPDASAAVKASAIVVSYNTGEVLFDCLAALERDPAISEIVLVNNGNPVEILERVEDGYGRSGRVKIIGGGVNRGFAAGVNLGAAWATGDWLLILNPDAVLQSGAVEALQAALADAADPAIAGGKIYGADGKEQRGGRRRRLTMRSAAATFLGLGWLKTVNPGFVNINRNSEPEPDGPVPMDAVSGAMMFISTESFKRLGGFDEGYFLHVEDIDICRRAEAEGGTVVYTPLASALHHGATSDAPLLEVERHKGAGLNRYFRKFAETPGEKLAASVLGPMIGLLLSARARLRKR
ncbi:MAG: glycosyltransferase family 2 protein [Hyphomonadaceae bacterium]|nr:glycosyltransferase family 2 protein [Hyphomonadaceae bacterium]